MDTDSLYAVLCAVREHPSSTAKSIALTASMEPAKVQRLLRELERRNVIVAWKRPGTRALLWKPLA